MKNIKKVLFASFMSFALTNTINANAESFEYFGNKKKCSKMAIKLYDDLINSEVDIATAFEVSQEAYYECLTSD